MNKMLAKVLLVCMILTCLSSGTMAIYTTKIDEATTIAITAKRFYIGVNSAAEFDIRLAPGEAGSSEFTITNTDVNGLPTEVDMNLTISADYSALYKTFPGVKVYLTEDGTDLHQPANDDGTFSYYEKQAFLAEQKGERTFRMIFDWQPTEENQIAASGKSVGGLALYITGTQYIP